MTKIFFLTVAIVFFLPETTFAIAGVPFGGLQVTEVPCTCSLAYAYAIFAPLYLGPSPTIGALAAPFYPVSFSVYELHAGSWALGFFEPGVQACLFYYGTTCAPPVIPYPVMGLITVFVGVSPL